MVQHEEQIVEGPARFTVITPQCIRMEYAPRHGFVDAPTLFAINRAARFPQARITRTDSLLVIETDMVRLEYRPDDQPFGPGNLKAVFRHGEAEVVWTAGQTNTRNLGGPITTLDGVGQPVPLSEGLLARDGWHVIDDSGRPLLIDGWVTQRPGGGPPAEPLGHGMTINRDLDWYLFVYGGDYQSALAALATLSGRAPMPRKHVLGSWYCRWHPYTAEEFRQIVAEYRQHDFPLDILVMDMDWHTQDARCGYGHAQNLGWTGYTWNRRLIPDPAGLLRELKDDGITVTLNDHPCDGIRDHEECYPAFMKILGRTPTSGGNPPFNAGDRHYMKALFAAGHTPLEQQGVDFWWVDWQQDHIYPSVHGVPWLRHLPWLNYLYYTHSQSAGRRGQGFSRWGGWGDHRHPIHFSGDACSCWEMLAFEVPFTLASSNAGCFYWAHDIGGFHGERNPETFTRWVQFGAMSAALRLHSTGANLDRRPWLWGEPFVGAMRSAFNLRSRLFPYIYTSVRQCYDRMLPLLRPMYIAYPDQADAYACAGQYLLGDHLLVAPIVTSGVGPNCLAAKSVWFPPGSWYNLFTGEKIEGGQTLNVSAGLEEFPLYARAGVPLPMQPYTPRMGTAPLTTLVVRCYPGLRGESTLYEDDGQTLDYTRDRCAWTQLRYELKDSRIRVQIMPVNGRFVGQPAERGYRIELPCTMPAAAATVNGQSVRVEYDEDHWMNIIHVARCAIGQSIEVLVHAEEIPMAIPAEEARRRRSTSHARFREQ